MGLSYLNHTFQMFIYLLLNTLLPVYTHNMIWYLKHISIERGRIPKNIICMCFFGSSFSYFLFDNFKYRLSSNVNMRATVEGNLV